MYAVFPHQHGDAPPITHFDLNSSQSLYMSFAIKEVTVVEFGFSVRKKSKKKSNLYFLVSFLDFTVHI